MKTAFITSPAGQAEALRKAYSAPAPVAAGGPQPIPTGQKPTGNATGPVTVAQVATQARQQKKALQDALNAYRGPGKPTEALRKAITEARQYGNGIVNTHADSDQAPQMVTAVGGLLARANAAAQEADLE